MSTNINTASSPTPPSAHGLTAGIYGVYCTRCNDTVKKNGNLLFPPDDNTIRNHLRKYHCYVGDTAPNAIHIERELERSQEAIHSAAKRNHELAIKKIALIFPNGSDTSIHRAHVCNNCGFSAKTKRNFSYHFGPRNYYGCLKDSHASKGMVDVCTGICNITCPKSFLEKAANGDLVLPKRQRLNDTNNKNIEAGQATAAITTTPPIQLPQQQFLQQFQSSETQLSAAMANTSYYDDGAYDEARIDEALSPFVDTTSTNRGDRGNIHFVKMHRQLVIKIIDADHHHQLHPQPMVLRQGSMEYIARDVMIQLRRMEIFSSLQTIILLEITYENIIAMLATPRPMLFTSKENWKEARRQFTRQPSGIMSWL